MVHFALRVMQMHSRAQNLGLELCNPESAVPFVGLCLAYFFSLSCVPGLQLD